MTLNDLTLAGLRTSSLVTSYDEDSRTAVSVVTADPSVNAFTSVGSELIVVVVGDLQLSLEV